MSKWTPTTDDEFVPVTAADAVYQAMQDWGAGQSEVSGFAAEDDERKTFSVVVAEGPGAVVAIHINWNTQEVVTAWREQPSASLGPTIAGSSQPSQVGEKP